MPFRILIMALAVIFQRAAVQATSFIERPFPEYVSQAPIIVRGKVGMSYSNWGAASDGTKRIYTFTELQSEEVLKGEVKSKTVIMRELGGQKDGIGMEVAGAARFERGEDIVIMLGPVNADGSHDVRGMMMAKYSVEKDSQGREVLDGAGLNSSEHAYHHDDEEKRAEPSPRIWTLDDLRTLIKNGAAREAAPAASSRPSPRPVAPSDAPASQAATPLPQASTLTAPSLQSPTPEESAGSHRLMLLALGILIGGAAYLLTRRR
jgi:hypothetical protein